MDSKNVNVVLGETKSFIQKIEISKIEISDEIEKIYDYTNREFEIENLQLSINDYGQLQPISVLYRNDKYFIVDGVLRFKAIKNLNLNIIDVIELQDPNLDKSDFTDFVIHNQIRKVKTTVEKINEISHILGIGVNKSNQARDKEKRVTFIVNYLGKGWKRNNVLSFEKILKWELKNGRNLNLPNRILNNEISINRVNEAIGLFNSNEYTLEDEVESNIIDSFLCGNYDFNRAQKLIEAYKNKKYDSPTTIKLHPHKTDNYEIIKGNIEEIELPKDFYCNTIFTSPPYYKLKKYGNDSNELGWEETPELYTIRLAKILMKCYDRLKPDGSMFINLGETYEDKECLAVIERLTMELIKSGAIFIDRIIWQKDANKPTSNKSKRFLPGYEVILHFAKSKDYYFDRFKILKPDAKLKIVRGCKDHADEKVSYHIPNQYAQFKNVISENKVRDVLNIQINSNRTKHLKSEQLHPATFSSLLPIIPILTNTPINSDSVIFDPFLGSGSCGRTSIMLGFKFVGVELYEVNINTSSRVLTEAQNEYDSTAMDYILGEIGLKPQKMA